ncbi:MAG: hypothetical protein ACJARU_002034 [Congregibacter sp.]|jgi:hypothetical protein
MDMKSGSTLMSEFLQTAQFAVSDTNTYIQFVVILVIYALSFTVACKIRHSGDLTRNKPLENAHPIRKLAFRIGGIFCFHYWQSSI